MEIKEDTYAIFKIIRADGTELPLIDSSSPDGETTSGYANFILQNVTEARMEKHQIVETFGESYIFFFGESPRFLDIQAVLVNSHDFNWEAEWWENYNRFLRGTKLVEMGARSYLFYDDNVVEGYTLMAQATKSATEPFLIQLSFRLFITNYTNISFIGDPHFPIRASVNLPDDVDLTKGDASALLITHFRGEALDQAQLQNTGDQEQLVGALRDGQLGQGAKLSKLLREAPPTFGFSNDVFSAIDRLSALEQTDIKNLIVRDGKPIRGLIAENVDEFVGVGDGRTNFGFEPGEIRPPSALSPTIRDQLEVEDLFRASIEFLSCFGANLNNNKSILKIGLGPIFSVGRNGKASFNPKDIIRVQGGFGVGGGVAVGGAAVAGGAGIGGAGFGVGSGFVGTVGGGNGVGSQTQVGGNNVFRKSFNVEPLGSVFGRPVVTENEFGPNRQRFVEGAGDPSYGYSSDFAGGPGFGQAGFGDFGGAGFGSGLSKGDPGFKDPSKFTFAGVSDNRSAFDRFLRPKPDPSTFGIGIGVGLSAHAGAGIGLGAGNSGVSGGGAVLVPGKPSPFALISVPGTLDPTGNARSASSQISEQQRLQRFGFSVDNPFGVTCPKPPGSFGFSDGFHKSFP